MGDSTNTQVMIAGAVAAFTVDLLVYPLDTIKTRYQSQDFRNVFGQTATSQGTGKQAQGQLFKGLYQGIGSVIFATLPAAGIFFITYESAKPAFRSGLPPATPMPLVHALASASAELASCLVLAPAEVIKQNAQMIRQPARRHDGPSASLQALRKIWRGSAGPARNVWTGYTALVARNLPFTSIHFPLFEFIRAQIWARRDPSSAGTRNANPQTDGSSIKRQTPPSTAHENGPKPGGVRHAAIETALVTGTSAALSGALAALITTPADVVKTQIMLSAGEPEARGRTKGPGIAKEIIREKGIRGIFRGGILRALWAALGGGLYLGSYEAAKVTLQGTEKPPRSDDGF